MHARMHVECIKRGEKFLSHGKQLKTFESCAILMELKRAKDFHFEHILWSSTGVFFFALFRLQNRSFSVNSKKKWKCCVWVRTRNCWLWLSECTALWQYRKFTYLCDMFSVPVDIDTLVLLLLMPHRGYIIAWFHILFISNNMNIRAIWKLIGWVCCFCAVHSVFCQQIGIRSWWTVKAGHK